MNVASLELCKELYELSGWQGDGRWYYADPGGLPSFDANGLHHKVAPAYTLGYLIRKLPHSGKAIPANFRIDFYGPEDWWAEWHADYDEDDETSAKTPEDAVTKLLINLLSSGILTNRLD